MKTALLFSTACAMLAASPAFSRPVAMPPYAQMMRDADLVAVATPTAVRDTAARTSFPGIQRDGEPVPAILVQADFEVLAVLKGPDDIAKFTLSYLRSSDPDVVAVNGPMLVWFEPSKKERYLLFLKRGDDGLYVPVNGQTDPVFSVKPLGTSP